jgi:hypothetical protein
LRAPAITLAVLVVLVYTAQSQIISGTVESQVELLKKRVTIEKQIGPVPLKVILEKLSDTYEVTFVVDTQAFEKAGNKSVEEAKTTVVAQKDKELSKVLEGILSPLKAKCVPDKGYLLIIPK